MNDMTLRKALLLTTLTTLTACAVDPADPDQALNTRHEIEQIDQIDEVDGAASEQDLPATHAPISSLFDLSLDRAPTPIAAMINGERAAAVVEGRFVNAPGQAVTLQLQVTAPATSFATIIVNDFVPVGPGRKAYPCGGPEQACSLQPPPAPNNHRVAGTVTGDWKTFVRDEATGQVVCSGSDILTCPLPTTAEPRAYRVSGAITGLREMAAGIGPLAPQMLGGNVFIGTLGESFDVCTHQRAILGENDLSYFQCMTSTRYVRFQAIERAELDLGRATLDLEVRAGAEIIDTLSFSSEARRWDAGEADVPRRE